MAKVPLYFEFSTKNVEDVFGRGFFILLTLRRFLILLVREIAARVATNDDIMITINI